MFLRSHSSNADVVYVSGLYCLMMLLLVLWKQVTPFGDYKQNSVYRWLRMPYTVCPLSGWTSSGIYKFISNKESNRQCVALQLTRVKTGEVIPDNTAPKSYLPLFVENYYWAFCTNSRTRRIRQAKMASKKVSSFVS